MPYIKQARREVFTGSLSINKLIDSIDSIDLSPGDLNFLFTTFINLYIRKQHLSYQTINDVMGALEGAKAEFYRRVAVPYEDKKILENGDLQ